MARGPINHRHTRKRWAAQAHGRVAQRRILRRAHLLRKRLGGTPAAVREQAPLHQRHCERQRSNPSYGKRGGWIASSQVLLAMTGRTSSGITVTVHLTI